MAFEEITLDDVSDNTKKAIQGIAFAETDEVSDSAAKKIAELRGDAPDDEVGMLGATGIGLAQGLTSGFTDEIGGAVLAMMDGASPFDDDFEEKYEMKRDEIREFEARAGEQHPVIKNLSEMGAFAATLPKSIGLAGAKGLANLAGRGAIAGAGAAEELEDVPGSAALGAVGGAAGGLAGPAVAKGVGAAGRGIEKAAEVAGKGLDKTAGSLGRVGDLVGKGKVNQVGADMVTDIAANLEAVGPRGAKIAEKLIDKFAADPNLPSKLVAKGVAAASTGGTSLAADAGVLAGKAAGKGLKTAADWAADPAALIGATSGTKFFPEIVDGIISGGEGRTRGTVTRLSDDPDFRKLLKLEEPE